MPATHITDADFESVVLKSDKPVLVDFWAEWCGPCQRMGPVLDEISDTEDGFTVAKLNVDENPERSQEFGIMSIPTMVLFQNGQATGQIVGAMPKEDVLTKVKALLS